MQPLALALTVLSLNLHGYHPSGEAPRFTEDRDGKLEAADSDLYFFQPDEIERGNSRRLDHLASELLARSPDVVLLQEVGAGSPWTTRDCSRFRAQGPDAFEKNAALRLEGRLGGAYRATVACRGNIGWQTDAKTFATRRVLRKAASGYEVVFDFGANPYPQGQIVEGLAVLLKPGYRVLEAGEWNVQHDFRGDRIFTQVLAAAPPGREGWFVVANQHLGRKVQHFEQAVALRRALSGYIAAAHFPGPFLGLLVGGDFNARLEQPATQPWLSALTPQAAWSLAEPLRVLNDDPEESWGRISDRSELDRRIGDALSSFSEFLGHEPQPRMIEALAGDPYPKRIDLLFAPPSWRIERASVIFQQDSWSSTAADTVSDHPGVTASYAFLVP